ncbi:hypothetical protein E2C01_002977 [Portunus trituberculatus]|uniref:Uncharacterized protein n=1 Tax=Portunus trituberculatus TaxID=210409 RepID=A0A5B7CSA8_PORTR|nr:hypothetical protein [Portunus trituberculatus]
MAVFRLTWYGCSMTQAEHLWHPQLIEDNNLAEKQPSVPSGRSRAVGSRARVPGENQVVIERKHVTVKGKDTHTLSLPQRLDID